MKHLNRALKKSALPLTLTLCFATGLAAAELEPKHSFSNPKQMLVTHTDLDLTIDFDKKILKGKATLAITRLNGTELKLDAAKLNIVSVKGDVTSWKKVVDQKISESGLGEPLTIITNDQDL